MESEVLRYVAAGVSMGLGALGPALAEGYVGGKAYEAIGRNPEAADKITSTLFVVMAICESTGIYALVVALLCIFA
ncbi:ATP synthase F0 subunit C [Microgenomates group bacterium]|nr:ATP synthase F0 subunit C [Microgenomates group bacterium]